MVNLLLSRKGQVLVEFIVLVGIALFIFSVVLIIVNAQSSSVIRSEKHTSSYIFVHDFRERLLLASTMYDGYAHTITLPEKVSNSDYSLVIENDYLIFQQEDILHIVPVHGVTGSINGSQVTVTKTSGGVFLS